jgi:LysR family hydrogen peroxide-inducible transcriptional activator
MNIRDLKYLIALVDHGHFGRAAEASFVSQPALSMQIKKLEETLGVKLVERTNKSMLVTEIGKAIAQRARQVLSQVAEIHEFAQSVKDPYSGELHLGIIPTLAPYLLPLIIPALSAAFPKLSLYLVEEQTARLVEKLKNGKIHAAILAQPVVETQFSSTLLFAECFLLAVPNHHHLAQKKKIMQKDLDKQNLLLLEEGHCMREQSLALCQQMHASEMQHFRATSLETLRHMVAAGLNITLMPQLACQASDSIAYVPFRDPQPSRSIALFWRGSTAKRALLEEMAGVIRGEMGKRGVVV